MNISLKRYQICSTGYLDPFSVSLSVHKCVGSANLAHIEDGNSVTEYVWGKFMIIQAKLPSLSHTLVSININLDSILISDGGLRYKLSVIVKSSSNIISMISENCLKRSVTKMSYAL